MNESNESNGLLFERQGAVARLTLDRPRQHNAMGAADVARFRGFLDEVEATAEIRVLVLTGSGDATFCSGAALGEMESGEMSGEIFEALTDHLEGLSVPTLCSLNGSAYGGGAEIALACDFRIGPRGIVVSVPAARLGICYPAGGLRRYVERLGLAAATRIFLAAEELDSDELLRIGFLTHRTDRADLAETTNALASRIAELAPLAVSSMKRLLRDITRGVANSDDVDRLVSLCADSEDLVEGLRAWREGRPPRFLGS